VLPGTYLRFNWRALRYAANRETNLLMQSGTYSGRTARPVRRRLQPSGAEAVQSLSFQSVARPSRPTSRKALP
jgi:hypothetical protein